MAKALKKKPTPTIEDKRLELGHVLMEARVNKGLSLKDLEAKVGIPGAVLCRIEHGINKLTLENAMRLADFYNMDLSDLADTLQ